MLSKSDLSEKISKDLKKRGFKFLGPTIIYSHLQATGQINDHFLSCFRYNALIDKSIKEKILNTNKTTKVISKIVKKT